MFNKLKTNYKNTKTERYLKPQFDYKSIKLATQFYIPTQYQNASPTRQEEPKFTHKYISQNPLISFFLKTAFKEKRESERFYLILADSGMGKTTFMVNLYMKYTGLIVQYLRRFGIMGEKSAMSDLSTKLYLYPNRLKHKLDMQQKAWTLS